MAKLIAYSTQFSGDLYMATGQEDLESFDGLAACLEPVNGEIGIQMHLGDSSAHYRGRLHEGQGAVYSNMKVGIGPDGVNIIPSEKYPAEHIPVNVRLTPGALIEFHKRVIDYSAP